MTTTKKATMRKGVAAATRKPARAQKPIFDDGEALLALAKECFDKAAKEEVSKNDALGIDTHGSINGKLAIRKAPSKSRKAG